MKYDFIHSTAMMPFPDPKALHVAVIGGGASGVLIASQLLRLDSRIRVTLIEQRNMLGCGVAYSTTDPDHLLNTRVGNMSAFPDQPDHFRQWLHDNRPDEDGSADSFVSRSTYGEYMSGLLRQWREQPEGGRLRCIRATCIRLQDREGGVTAHLSDGQTVLAHLAVLATGHALPASDPDSPLTGAWEFDGDLPRDGRAIIIGSGLSMVDTAISLLRSGHRGEIVAISRHGRLPHVHLAGTPLAISADEVPFGAPMSFLVSWLRAVVRRAEESGGTWRDAVDGLRPHLTRIWRSLPLAERARFLRHAASLWEIHRHRLPPESARPIRAALKTGQMRLVPARFIEAQSGADGRPQAVIRPRGGQRHQIIPADRILDCRGIRRDPETHASPLVAGLLRDGHARVDALRLGLDVAETSALIGRDGVPSQTIFALGPVSRAEFWEITAIPDIRDQAQRLAQRIVETQAEVLAGSGKARIVE